MHITLIQQVVPEIAILTMVMAQMIPQLIQDYTTKKYHQILTSQELNLIIKLMRHVKKIQSKIIHLLYKIIVIIQNNFNTYTWI